MEALPESAQKLIIVSAIEAAAKKAGVTVETVVANLSNPQAPNCRKMVEKFIAVGVKEAAKIYK